MRVDCRADRDGDERMAVSHLHSSCRVDGEPHHADRQMIRRHLPILRMLPTLSTAPMTRSLTVPPNGQHHFNEEDG